MKQHLEGAFAHAIDCISCYKHTMQDMASMQPKLHASCRHQSHLLHVLVFVCCYSVHTLAHASVAVTAAVHKM